MSSSKSFFAFFMIIFVLIGNAFYWVRWVPSRSMVPFSFNISISVWPRGQLVVPCSYRMNRSCLRASTIIYIYSQEKINLADHRPEELTWPCLAESGTIGAVKFSRFKIKKIIRFNWDLREQYINNSERYCIAFILVIFRNFRWKKTDS